MKERSPIEKTEIAERESIDSCSVGQIERDPDNFLTKKSRELVEIFDIPQGAFSGLATYKEDGKEIRMSPTLDGFIAEHFTNTRHIVDRLNNIGPISTKDPRERYDGEMDAVIEKTTQELNDFEKEVTQELTDLEKRRGSGDISEKGYEKSRQFLKDTSEIYRILIQELKLKKKGFDLLGKGDISWDNIGFRDLTKTNCLLEIKYLPGGGFIVLRGYIHDAIWQLHFGHDYNRTSLANIYKDVQYVAIEGRTNLPYGESIKFNWEKSLILENYDRLIKELVRNGFKGEFLELDSRFCGENEEKTFTFLSELTFGEAKIFFSYLEKYNPQLARNIGSVNDFIEIFHKQDTKKSYDFFEEIRQIEKPKAIKDGTYYPIDLLVKKNKEGEISRSFVLTGLELGQMAFSDAFSVIKILLMNKAMQDGKLKRGIVVDFQGANHLSYKSYFFDNPGYAMEVVLNNIHELLASHPDIKDREDILSRLQNLDKDTWKWVFDFIGTIPFYKVAEKTEDKYSVEAGDKQRPINKQKTYIATEELSKDNKNKLNKVIEELSKK